ncbi:hypothetical protein Q5Y75_26810 [Ruegeria sp. 2205SS24-7]|uniref:hypothetical protein n=1 Tax=Ruegeria discodermiae TaxID=3064389 RepID=UPI002741BC49|nr:hypothetical protein [Ruegeria sp. 2205SS24-7]MDP5220802.1 hypothetical protein [Ruegeria sp. 2205SS24-7]
MNRFMERLSQGFEYLIVLASAIMLGWGLLGFLEYFTGLAPLMPLQNATFPLGMQTLHWILITASGATFLAGYVLRWSFTPIAMLVIFTALATMCAVQTFDMLENPDRYQNFAQECVNYIIISIYLFRSKRMGDRFGRIIIQGGDRVSPQNA